MNKYRQLLIIPEAESFAFMARLPGTRPGCARATQLAWWHFRPIGYICMRDPTKDAKISLIITSFTFEA